MAHFIQFIQHHWQLATVFVAMAVLTLINELLEQRKRPTGLSPQGVIQKINHEGAVVLDIRDQESFSAGHIINAVRIAEQDINETRLKKYKSKPIILVCARGLQSVPLANRLKSNGTANPLVLAGGMTAWQAADFPLVKGNK